LPKAYSKIKTFINLPQKAKMLFAEAWTLSCIARILSFMPLKWYSGWLGKYMGDVIENKKATTNLQAIKKAIKLSAKYSFFKPKCLVDAITAKKMLDFRKQNAIIYFGVALNDSELKAHAWVESNGIIIAGEAQASRFKPVSWFT
jgi:hypothetical protein